MLNYNISFYLRTSRKQEDGKIPIYTRIRLENERLEISINQSIEQKFWNNNRQQVIKSPDAALINSVINEFHTDLLQVITNLQLSKADVTIENVRKLLKGEQVVQNYCLIKVLEEHNRNFEKLVGVQYSYGSYKNYKTTLAFLKEFINNRYKRHDLPLKQIDHKFCEQYCIWLTTVKTCHQNGTGKHIQRLKKILNYSARMGYIINNPAAGYVVKIKSVARVALTWEEINSIQQLQLKTERLQSIRDIFVFQVFTGLAYADIKAFCPRHLWKNIDGKVWIRMERTKTRNTFTVPLLPPAIEILQKYMPKEINPEQPVFPVVSNQKMNANLKIIQEIAGINKSLHTHLRDEFHTFHIHGHRWVLPGPLFNNEIHNNDLQFGGPLRIAASQFEDTRIFGPANSFVFTINEGEDRSPDTLENNGFMGAHPSPGEWHMHCHVPSHMMNGMMGSLLIVNEGDPAPPFSRLPMGIPSNPVSVSSPAAPVDNAISEPDHGQDVQATVESVGTTSWKDTVSHSETTTINAGDRVRWTTDGIYHTIKNDAEGMSKNHPESKFFASDDIALDVKKESSLVLSFPNPGTFYYMCGRHSDMKGTVVVNKKSDMPGM